jgi:diaminohydroxyphosphoribosylaminopyrimidine deaminase/5-amino-6-(5-phosphoribosylamino)uracil reductase
MIEADARVYEEGDCARGMRCAGLVSPNPMVGALLVKNGRVIGEGFHRYDLLKHGEIYAIRKWRTRKRGEPRSIVISNLAATTAALRPARTH